MASALAADDIDGLIGSLQSVHAGDRGHAIEDLRDTLFASLGRVALGPPGVHDVSNLGRHDPPGVPYQSPPTLPNTRALLSPLPHTSGGFHSPPASHGRSTPVRRSCVGSHGEQSPSTSLVRPVIHASRRGYPRAQPYSAGRPRPLAASSAPSRYGTRHTTPEHSVSATLAELHLPSASHSRAGSRYRSRSASNVSHTPVPAQAVLSVSPLASDCSLTQGRANSPVPGAASHKPPAPAWAHTFAFIPMHWGIGVKPPSGSSVASVESAADSAAANSYKTDPAVHHTSFAAPSTSPPSESDSGSYRKPLGSPFLTP